MTSPSVSVAIPARYDSTRLPGKLLLDETGRPLLQYAYENAIACDRVDTVYVATDSDRIASAARDFGARVLRTGTHPSGTDRLSEAVAEIDEEIIINLQGDEPEVSCPEIHRLVELMTDNHWEMGTLCTPISDPNVLRRTSCVKVVVSKSGRALYFSRAPIPWDRDEFPVNEVDPDDNLSKITTHSSSSSTPWKLHVGIYGFTRTMLRRWSSLEAGTLERIEGLEQLRALEHDVDVGVAEIEEAPIGIDTRDEYDAFKRKLDE